MTKFATLMNYFHSEKCSPQSYVAQYPGPNSAQGIRTQEGFYEV